MPWIPPEDVFSKRRPVRLKAGFSWRPLCMSGWWVGPLSTGNLSPCGWGGGWTSTGSGGTTGGS